MELKYIKELIEWRAYIDSVYPRANVIATNGCFDILHFGHVYMLQEAKRMYGQFLVVGLNSDESVKKLKGPTRPINNQINRKKVLEALKVVDFVQIFDDTNCSEFIKIARPTVYIKSSDYSLENLNREEYKALQSVNSDIKFIDLVKGLSTTNILSKI